MRSSRFETWRKAAHTKLGEQLFRKARADFEAGTTGAIQGNVHVAKALAGVIILTPVAFILGGLAFMSVDFPNLIPLVVGAILVMCGLYVFPWPATLPAGGYRRDELPDLFQMTDEIGARMGAEPLTLIYLDDQFNAGYFELRGERALSLGFTLWVTLTPPERVALIAHELSHQVNGDVSRAGIVGYGLYALQRWQDLFGSSEIVAHDGYLLREREGAEVFAAGLMGLASGFVDMLWALLTRLVFVDSQRSEYLADALSTRAGGVQPARNLLSKLALLPLVQAQLRGLVPSYIENGTAYYDKIAQSVFGAPQEARKALFDEIIEQEHSVDASHPPTFQRIAFLSGIAEPEQGAVAYHNGVDAELAPHLEQSGADVLAVLEEQ